MRQNGYTTWARKTLDSEIFLYKPDSWFKIWFYIVNKVNYEDNHLFKRGTGFMSFDNIEKGTDTTRGQVDSFIRWAKKERMLTTRKTTRGFIVTVLKYSKYQDYKTYTNDTPHETKTTQKRHRNDTISKEVKEVKEINEVVRETPADKMRGFIKSVKTQDKTYKDMLEYLQETKGIPKEVSSAEVLKFVAYWTELTKSGKQQRWELEKTFEVQRRLGNWFSRIRSNNVKVGGKNYDN